MEISISSAISNSNPNSENDSVKSFGSAKKKSRFMQAKTTQKSKFC